MSKNFVHVVFKRGAWIVEVEEELTSPTPQEHAAYETREAAVEAGRELAKETSVELIVHRQDGTIGERDSYGNDPRDIPG